MSGSYKSTDAILGSVTTRESALTATTPAKRRTPYSEQDPGTKGVALDENWTSEAANRLASALAINIDNISDALTTPIAIENTLQFRQTSGVSTGVYGFGGLTFTDPADIAVSNYPEVNLGSDVGSVEPPAVWLYVGLLKKSLQNGSYMVFNRDANQDDNGVTSGNDKASSAYVKKVYPSYVKDHSGGSDYHGTQNYLGTSPHGYPDSIPGIEEVASDIYPFQGIVLSDQVASWSRDGLTITSNQWKALHAKVGCFVHVAGSTYNDGIYQIKSMADKKAVLSRGNLLQITVTNGGLFTKGQLVSWASPPNHTAGASTLDQRENKAYVVWKDTNTLWLARVGSELDSGSAVTSKADATLGALTSWSFGDFGQLDQETGATANHIIPVGTLLYPVDFTSPTFVTSTDVLSVVPPSWPLGFDVEDSTGGGVEVRLCSPPGYLLNPVVALPSIASDPQEVLPGSYRLTCRTLSTLQEKLLRGINYTDDVTGDPGARIAGHAEDREAEALTSMLHHLHHGEQIDEDYERTLNHAYSPTRNILGPSLYLIRGTEQGVPSNGLGLPFENGDAAFDPGDWISIAHPTAASPANSYACVVAGWGEYLLVRDVIRTWTNPWQRFDFSTFKSIEVGSTFTDSSATTYEVTAVWHPKIYTSLIGTTGSYIEAPPGGLNSEFHNYYSGTDGLRQGATGNAIMLSSGKALSLHLPQNTNEVAIAYTSDQNQFEISKAYSYGNSHVYASGLDGVYPNMEAYEEIRAKVKQWRDSASAQIVRWDFNTANMLRLGVIGTQLQLDDISGAFPIKKAELDWQTNSLGFTDVNIDLAAVTVYLSDAAPHNAIPDFTQYTTEPNILSTLHASLLGGVDHTVVSNGVLRGGRLTASATLLNLDLAEVTTLVWRDRKYETAATNDVATMPPSVTRYAYYDPTVTPPVIALDSNLDLDDDEKLYLARVTSDATSITEIVSIKSMIGRVDATTNITVGRDAAASDYFNNMTNFATLGEALKAIEVWNVTTNGDRSYRIHVVSKTTEINDASVGVTAPYPIPVDGLEIIGSNSTDDASAVTWSSDTFLLNLNCKNGVRIKGLRFVCNNTTHTHGPSISLGVFTNSSTPTSTWDASIEECTLLNTGTVYSEAFFHADDPLTQGTCENLVLSNNRGIVTNTFLHLADSVSDTQIVEVHSNHFYFDADTGGVSSAAGYGVFVDVSTRLIVSNNSFVNIAGGLDTGVLTYKTEDTLVDNNLVKNSLAYGVRAVPYDVSTFGDTKNCKINNNTIDTCSYAGIELGIPFSFVANNTITNGCSNAAVTILAEAVIVSENTINNVASNGIVLVPHIPAGLGTAYAARDSKDIIVKGNQILDACVADISGDAPIALYEFGGSAVVTKNCLVLGNNIRTVYLTSARSNVTNSIIVGTNCVSNTVEGNNIHGDFALDIRASHCKAVGNTFNDSGGNIILVKSSDTLVLDNKFVVITAAAPAPNVLLDPSSTNIDRVTVKGNCVIGSLSALASIASANSGYQSKYNVISANAGFSSIVLWCDESEIRNNTKQVDDLVITVNGDNNSIVANNSGSGTLTLAGNHNRVCDNRIDNSSCNIDGDYNVVTGNTIGSTTASFSAAAITFSQGAAHNSVVGNVILHRGIVFGTSGGVACTNNNIANNNLADAVNSIIEVYGNHNNVVSNNIAQVNTSAIEVTGDYNNLSENKTFQSVTVVGDYNGATGNNIEGTYTSTGKFNRANSNYFEDDVTINPINAAGSTTSEREAVATFTGNICHGDVTFNGGRNHATANILYDGSTTKNFLLHPSALTNTDYSRNAISANKTAGPITAPAAIDDVLNGDNVVN